MDNGRSTTLAHRATARGDPDAGPYDFYAITGYHPLPAAATPDAERPTLDSLRGCRTAIPMLRFGNADRRRSEAQPRIRVGPHRVHHARPEESRAVMPMLLPATTSIASRTKTT